MQTPNNIIKKRNLAIPERRSNAQACEGLALGHKKAGGCDPKHPPAIFLI